MVFEPSGRVVPLPVPPLRPRMGWTNFLDFFVIDEDGDTPLHLALTRFKITSHPVGRAMLAQAAGGGKEEEGEAAALLDIAAALAGKGAPLHLRQVQSVRVPESLERVFFQLEHP